MCAGPSPADGVERFLADLEEEGLRPARCGNAITYVVVPAAGRLAGTEVATGVSVSEVQSWPMVPPHWIHLPDEVTFAHTNTDTTDCAPGWRRHSRDSGPWNLTRKPIHIWLAHIRGVLGQAA
jgi:hypothetical protein